jgi:hypothetical protein
MAMSAIQTPILIIPKDDWYENRNIMDKAAPVRNMPATNLSGVPPFHKAKKQAAHKIIRKAIVGIS